jgi:hypothetical protein
MNKILIFLLIAGLVLVGTISTVHEISEQAHAEPHDFAGEPPTTSGNDESMTNEGISGGGGSGGPPIPG